MPPVDRETTIELTSYVEVDEALRDLALPRGDRQDFHEFVEGNVLEDSIVVLHGDEHKARRQAEAPVFARNARREFERELFPTVIGSILPAGAETVDLVELSKEVSVVAASRMAGLAIDEGSAEERNNLARMASMFASGAAIEDSAEPFSNVKAKVSSELDRFDSAFFTHAWEALQGTGDPPGGVLARIHGDRQALGLTRDKMLRETAFFMAAATDTSAHSICNLFKELFALAADQPALFDQLAEDPYALQLHVHEALRLNSIVPYVRRRALERTVVGGRTIKEGTKVVISLSAASRDPSVFGPDANEFDARRELDPTIPRYGHAFGGGMHACLGRALAAGTPVRDPWSQPRSNHLFGTITVLAQAILRRGVAPHPSRPPELDPTSQRTTKYQRFPVLLGDGR